MIRLRNIVFAPVGVLALVATFAMPDLAAAKNDRERFEASMSGAQEVPARTTGATGRGRSEIKDGGELHYDVHVNHIENVVVSHIHAGEAGANGPVCVTLYGPVDAGGGRENGKLADGTATALDANLTDANRALCGGTFEGFLALHRDGKTYFNVHTNDGDGTPNERPGDFPGGEIRGQALPRG
jgi:hypothetical protein